MIERLVQIIGLLRLRQRHLPVSPQLALDASCKFVKEAADGVQRETLKVNEDGNVFGIKVMAELVEDRGLPCTHLAIQGKNIALVLANKAFGDELEDIISSEEHRPFRHRASRDVRIRMLLLHHDPPPPSGSTMR